MRDGLKVSLSLHRDYRQENVNVFLKEVWQEDKNQLKII
jgi:hypothetical protein